MLDHAGQIGYLDAQPAVLLLLVQTVGPNQMPLQSAGGSCHYLGLGELP